VFDCIWVVNMHLARVRFVPLDQRAALLASDGACRGAQQFVG
jgi:hypothetical protein